MQIINRIAEAKAVAKQELERGRKIGFIPTMGAIHEGHLSLVRRAREMSDVVLVSVFVNPLQFGANEDYDRYPSELTRDANLLAQENIDYLFAPTVEEMYPKGFSTYVQVRGLSERLCGVSRPSHFGGVTTAVVKLFNITSAAYAFFGQKDAQQTVIIQRMVRDLSLSTNIIVCPTVRERDGLAYSSRNQYLSQEQRRAATVLYRALQEGQKLIVEQGEKKSKEIIGRMTEIMASEPLARADYIAIVDPETLEPVREIDDKALIAVAAYFGTTRLIDNVIINSADKKVEATKPL